MIIEDQSETIALLEEALTRIDAPDGGLIEKIVTHGSVILLGATRVFKLKRAVRYAYLDFSTAPKRLRSCENELALNRRTAPDLYLAVRRVTRDPDGNLALDGEGALVDAVVEMRRFSHETLFDKMAEQGKLSHALMDRLAKSIARFHADAQPDYKGSGAENMAAVIAINDSGLRDSQLVGPVEAARFTQACRDALDRHRQRLDERARAGKVRRCHGDLILRNIFLDHGEPTLFDCIDFNDELATIDVLYDLAFLLMDLSHRDLPDLANRLFNRYLDETGDDDGAGLLPFFMAIRAVIRAHVGATQAKALSGQDAESVLEEARAYYAMANDLLVRRSPVLIAIGGLSGTGKSTVAAHLAGHVGSAPGARIFNSDRLRKAQFGVEPGIRLPPEAYASEVSGEIYARLRECCGNILTQELAAIADAVFDRPAEREAIAAIAENARVSFLGIWLEAGNDVLSRRVETRAQMQAQKRAEENPSDADLAVLEVQLQRDCGTIAWTRIDAAQDAVAIRDEILRLVGPDTRM